MKKPTFRFLTDSVTDTARKKWIELVLPYAEYILHTLRETPWASFETQIQDYAPFAKFPVKDPSEGSNYDYYLHDADHRQFSVGHHTAHGVVEETAFVETEREVPSTRMDVYDEDVVFGEDDMLKREFKGRDHYRVVGDGDHRAIYEFIHHRIKFLSETPFILVGGCCLEIYASALDSVLGVNIRDFVDTTADVDVHVFIDDKHLSLDEAALLEKARAFIHENFTRKISPLLKQIGDLKVDDSNDQHYQYELTYPPKGSKDPMPPFSDHILDVVLIVLGDTTPPDAAVLNGYPLRNLWMEAQRGFLRTLEETLTPTKYAITQRRFKYILTLLWKIYDPAITHQTCVQLRDSVKRETIQTFWEQVWRNPKLPAFFDRIQFLTTGNNNAVNSSIKRSYDLF